MRFFKGYVKKLNAAYVILELWNPGGPEERFSIGRNTVRNRNDRGEDQRKIQPNGRNSCEAIQNHESAEIGYHEIFNSWLSSDPWEMAQACEEKSDNYWKLL